MNRNNKRKLEEMKDNMSKGLLGQLRKHGMTQKELAHVLGVDNSTVGKWISKTTLPRMGIIQQISDYFGLPKSYFLEDKNPPIEAMRIKVYGSIPAGIPLEAIEDIQGWEDIPMEWTKGNKEYIALKVQGDSMYPKYLEGDTVIILLQENCESGQDCACYVKGHNATLKTVIKNNTALTLKPHNPNYSPATYTNFNDVVILGVVKEIRRKV